MKEQMRAQTHKALLDKKSVIVSCIILSLMQIVQGGYFPDAYLPVGVILILVLLFLREEISVDKYILFVFLALTTVNILVSLYYKTTESSCRIFYVLDILLCYCLFASYRKNQTAILKGLLVSVIIQEMIGVLAYSGISLNGIIMVNRFMGNYQYANVTAMVLAFGIIISENVDIGDLSHYLLLHYVFLFLTGSVGGILTYVLIEIVIVCCKKADRWEALCQRALNLMLAAIFGVGIYFFRFSVKSGWIVFLLFAGTVWFGYNWDRICRNIITKRWISALIVSAFIVLGIVLAIQLVGRAGATFVERLWQMKDAIGIVAEHPVLGIGTGALKEKLYLYRTHTYNVSLIHNSFLQIAVESGLPAFVCMIALVFCVVKDIGKSAIWKKALFGGAFVHALFDIDFFFLGYMGLLTVCMIEKEPHENDNLVLQRSKLSFVLLLLVLLSFLIMCKIYFI